MKLEGLDDLVPHCNFNDFIMFPSHIEHFVEENKTDIPRISLAFNIKVTGSEYPE